jgi:hypothetical protein
MVVLRHLFVLPIDYSSTLDSQLDDAKGGRPDLWSNSRRLSTSGTIGGIIEANQACICSGLQKTPQPRCLRSWQPSCRSDCALLSIQLLSKRSVPFFHSAWLRLLQPSSLTSLSSAWCYPYRGRCFPMPASAPC